MGIAVVQVSEEFLQEALLTLRVVGRLVSVTYPTDPWGKYCDVRIETLAVPDGEHKAIAIFNQAMEGLTATLTVELKLVVPLS